MIALFCNYNLLEFLMTDGCILNRFRNLESDAIKNRLCSHENVVMLFRFDSVNFGESMSDAGSDGCNQTDASQREGDGSTNASRQTCNSTTPCDDGRCSQPIVDI